MVSAGFVLAQVACQDVPLFLLQLVVEPVEDPYGVVEEYLQVATAYDFLIVVMQGQAPRPEAQHVLGGGKLPHVVEEFLVNSGEVVPVDSAPPSVASTLLHTYVLLRYSSSLDPSEDSTSFRQAD